MYVCLCVVVVVAAVAVRHVHDNACTVPCCVAFMCVYSTPECLCVCVHFVVFMHCDHCILETVANNGFGNAGCIAVCRYLCCCVPRVWFMLNLQYCFV